MNNGYSKKIQGILAEGLRCKQNMVAIGPTGPTGPSGGAMGPTGPTVRCNKSSIYIFKW